MSMNQFFDVANSEGQGCFISAKDKKDAIRIAMAIGHIKKASSAKVYGPKDMSKDTAYNSLKEIFKSRKSGQLFKQVPCITIMDVIAGKKIGPSKWLLHPISLCQ